MAIHLDIVRGEDGKIRVNVWDHFTTWGSKYKDDMETTFDEVTLGQMMSNWLVRGDQLPMDYNHQSNFVRINGQPAPALAFYDALMIVRSGEIVRFEKLSSSTASIPLSANGNPDGLWGYRCEVTELGEQLLPNFKFISPTFSPDGVDENGEKIGYVLHAVAATNVPFQSGTQITFTGTRRAQSMAKFEEGKLEGEEEGKMSYAKKMEEARKLLEDGDAEELKKMAEELEGYAAKLEEESEGGEEVDKEPHMIMRKLAARMAKYATMEEEDGDPPFGGKETPSEEAAEHGGAKMEEEDEDTKSMQAMALELGLPKTASARQVRQAFTAKTTSLSQVGALEKRIAEMESQQKSALKVERKRSAEMSFEQAIALGRTKEEKRSVYVAAYERNPTEAEALLFDSNTFPSRNVLGLRLTNAGAPSGVNPREMSVGAGPDHRIVSMSMLASGAKALVIGENLSKVVNAMADSKDPKVSSRIDGLLPEGVKGTSFESYHRYVAAEKLVETDRPELVRAANEDI